MKQRKELNKTRAISTDRLYPPKPRLADGTRICRRCDKPLPKGRIKWCSNACSEDALVRCNPGIARESVKWRDRGVCAQCGCNTERIKNELENLKKQASGYNREGFIWRKEEGARAAQEKMARNLLNMLAITMREDGFNIRPGNQFSNASWSTLWEMDHVVPVAEGGGTSGLDNLRTLCIPDHKAETRALVAGLAQERRNKKPLPLFDEQEVKQA